MPSEQLIAFLLPYQDVNIHGILLSDLAQTRHIHGINY